MKIIYDYQILMRQKYGGISRYYFELIKAMKRLETRNEIFLPIKKSKNYYFRNHIKPFSRHYNRIDGYINGISTIRCIKKEKKRGKPIDIIHPTYYYPDYLKWVSLECRNDFKIVITVYDLICELFYPNVDHQNLETRKKTIREADGIIAISEHTKKDLLKVYPELDESKVKVIYLANSMEKPEKKPENIDFPSRYVLFVGNREIYKNGERMLKAFSIVAKQFPDVKLLCAGGGKFYPAELEFIQKEGLEERIIQRNVTDEELYYAYKNAECFVFPSLYEGFGIPILEAFFCECPVALSNASCFPEVAGDAGVYFNGEEEEDIARAVSEILSDEEKRQQLRVLGTERLKLFSWDKNAEETLEFYKEILSKEETKIDKDTIK